MDLTNPGKTIPNQVDDIAGEMIRRWGKLRANRGNWEIQWQEISEIVYPNDSRSFQGQLITQGEKRSNQKLYDSTANIALSRFVAILESLLTPHNAKWHRLHTDDPALNKNRKVQEYFETVNNILFRERYLDTANFVEHNQAVYNSLGAYGTGALFIDQLWGQPGFRYKFIHLGELYFSENHQGIPDEVHRYFRMTAKQAYQKWGEKCPEIIKQNATDNPETLYEFLHSVVPRDGYDPQRLDFRGMPWAAYEISVTGNQLLTEGGYRTFPYAISRYSQSLQEVYGRGPAMDVLPTIKTLNEEKKSILIQAHRANDPIYLVHDDGQLPSMSAKPGTVIGGGVNADGRPLVHTLPTGNVQLGQEIMQDDRTDIKDAFLSSFFQFIAESEKEMTATEVLEKVKEKGILLAPTVGRQETYLSRVINREIDLGKQQRKFPLMPKVLQERGGQYKIRYESPLAMMRRAEEAAGMMRLLQTATQIVQATQDPTPMYFFNWTTIMPEMAKIDGVPLRWINDDATVAAMKQAANQQKATENAIQAGPSVAALAKAVGPANTQK